MRARVRCARRWATEWAVDGRPRIRNPGRAAGSEFVGAMGAALESELKRSNQRVGGAFGRGSLRRLVSRVIGAAGTSQGTALTARIVVSPSRIA